MGSNTANILHAAGMLLGTIGLRHGRLYRASARKLQQNRLLMVAASEVPHVTREKLAVSTGHSFLLKCLFQLTKASAKGLNRASGMNRLSVRLRRYLRPSGPSRPNYSAISRVITCRYNFFTIGRVGCARQTWPQGHRTSFRGERCGVQARAGSRRLHATVGYGFYGC